MSFEIDDKKADKLSETICAGCGQTINNCCCVCPFCGETSLCKCCVGWRAATGG